MSNHRILVVEDNPDHRLLIMQALDSRGPSVRVETTESGRQAELLIAESQGNEFQAVICDFRLPDCEAAELLPRLKSVGMRCPCVVISSCDSQQVVIESMRSGGCDFIPKLEAIQPDLLWARLDRLISEWQAEEEHRRLLQRRTRKLLALAQQDPLTGLANRRVFDAQFQDRRHQLDRRGWCTVAMIDLDHFKAINDLHGHDTGDAALRHAANVIRQSIGNRDLACRWGGEEFVILKRAEAEEHGWLWAEELRSRLECTPLAHDDELIHLTVSIGLYICPSEQLEQEHVVLADRAAYLAKSWGRNRVCTWSMVEFVQLAEEIGEGASDCLESRLRKVLHRTRNRLGPTQRFDVDESASRVGDLAARVGQLLDIDPESQQKLRLAGLCHDLGKVIVPEHLLAKRGPLTPGDRRILKSSLDTGARLTHALGGSDEVANLVRRGERNLEADILAATDAFVSLTSNRPYRPAQSATTAIATLRRNRIDPSVVIALSKALLQAHG